jgi:hypothetical protein
MLTCDKSPSAANLRCCRTCVHSSQVIVEKLEVSARAGQRFGQALDQKETLDLGAAGFVHRGAFIIL